MEIYNEKFKKGVVYNVFDLPLPQVFISKYFSSIEINADTLEPIKEDEEANDTEEYENYYAELVHEQGTDSDFAVEMCEDLFRENLCKRFEVIPIALTMEQIDHYMPPPNPAKITDPRAKDFIRLHGNTSWEVDALKPEVLNRLLHDAISDNLDQNKYDAILATEKEDIKKLKKLTKDL